MAVNVDGKIRKLSTIQRKKLEVRTAELIAEEKRCASFARPASSRNSVWRSGLESHRTASRGLNSAAICYCQQRLSTLRETAKVMDGN